MSIQSANGPGTDVQLEKKDHIDKIDFKMVTFSLAGKEYGIDIMNIKEIANAGRFTYVPNAAPFVRGVYNLRGDIISVIDLRIMFHLSANIQPEDALESLLILRVEDHIFGVIVDHIDRVIGVSSDNVQPPHPIFGDINIKYIKGVVENNGKLYIILNVDKLFAYRKADEEEKDSEAAAGAEADATAYGGQMVQQGSYHGVDDVNFNFISENLLNFKHFVVSRVNDIWFARRFDDWATSRKSTEIQLRDNSDAEKFLENFYSPCTGKLWTKDYCDALISVLPHYNSKAINIWNPGCGKGFETYSMACMMKRLYSDCVIKIWANDSDLLSVSMAPNMVFGEEANSGLYSSMVVKGHNGYTFNQAIRDTIMFEFHDVMNANPVPPVDIIICRDVLSFLSNQEQNRLIAQFTEKLKPNGVLVLGANENMFMEGWVKQGNAMVQVFVKS